MSRHFGIATAAFDVIGLACTVWRYGHSIEIACSSSGLCGPGNLQRFLHIHISLSSSNLQYRSYAAHHNCEVGHVILSARYLPILHLLLHRTGFRPVLYLYVSIGTRQGKAGHDSKLLYCRCHPIRFDPILYGRGRIQARPTPPLLPTNIPRRAAATAASYRSASPPFLLGTAPWLCGRLACFVWSGSRTARFRCSGADGSRCACFAVSFRGVSWRIVAWRAGGIAALVLVS